MDFLTLENGDCPAYFLTWRLSGHAHEVPRGSFERGAQKEHISSLQLFDQIPRS